METKKSLNIVKYNNTIKKRIKMNISNYKEYSEKFLSIEIEIKPFNNKFGKFINFSGDKQY